MPIIIQKETCTQRSNTLVIGSGIDLAQTTDGLPLLSSQPVGEAVISPSGSDDTAAIRALMSSYSRIRLAPGTFTVSGIIDVPVGVVVTGSGHDQTTISKTNYNGAVFRFGDTTQYCGVENLHIVGPGKTVGTGNIGVIASRSVNGLPISRRLAFRNLRIEEMSDNALFLDKCANVLVENCVIINVGLSGIYVSNGGSIHFSGVRLQGIGNTAIRLAGATGAVLSACESESSPGLLFCDAANDVVVNGCVSRKASAVPLKIVGGSNVVVNGFRSDNTGTGTFYNQPHLLVDTAAGVEIFGFRRTNTDAPGTLTSEADVHTAGSAVLVGYHNFDTTKVLSSGKFAQITSTPLP